MDYGRVNGVHVGEERFNGIISVDLA